MYNVKLASILTNNLSYRYRIFPVKHRMEGSLRINKEVLEPQRPISPSNGAPFSFEYPKRGTFPLGDGSKIGVLELKYITYVKYNV